MAKNIKVWFLFLVCILMTNSEAVMAAVKSGVQGATKARAAKAAPTSAKTSRAAPTPVTPEGVTVKPLSSAAATSASQTQNTIKIAVFDGSVVSTSFSGVKADAKAGASIAVTSTGTTTVAPLTPTQMQAGKNLAFTTIGESASALVTPTTSGTEGTSDSSQAPMTGANTQSSVSGDSLNASKK